ncbi:unnamed protein product [Brassica oleracea var. botrytis]
MLLVDVNISLFFLIFFFFFFNSTIFRRVFSRHLRETYLSLESLRILRIFAILIQFLMMICKAITVKASIALSVF